MTTKFSPRTVPMYDGVIYVGQEIWDSVFFTNELETDEELTGTPVFTPASAAVTVNPGTPALATKTQPNDTATALMTAVSSGRVKIWVECDTTNNQHLVKFVEWEIKARL